MRRLAPAAQRQVKRLAGGISGIEINHALDPVLGPCIRQLHQQVERCGAGGSAQLMQRLQALACKRCLGRVFNHQVLRRAGQGGHVSQGQVRQPAGAGDAVDDVAAGRLSQQGREPIGRQGHGQGRHASAFGQPAGKRPGIGLLPTCVSLLVEQQHLEPRPLPGLAQQARVWQLIAGELSVYSVLLAQITVAIKGQLPGDFKQGIAELQLQQTAWRAAQGLPDCRREQLLKNHPAPVFSLGGFALQCRPALCAGSAE